MVEAHPVLMCFDDRASEPALRLLYPYFHGPEPIREERAGCYSDPDAAITSVEHVWLHPLSAILGADGWWRLPADRRLPQGPGSLPLMFSLKATLP
jgi:hypothetical protein